MRSSKNTTLYEAAEKEQWVDESFKFSEGADSAPNRQGLCIFTMMDAREIGH